MSLVIPPGYGLAAFVLTGPVGTQPYVTTCGVDLRNVGGDFVAAADNCFLAYSTNVLQETSNQLQLDRVTLSVGQDGGGGSVDSTETPQPGLRSGNFPPTAMSAIMRKTTNRLGRAGRGRMFIPAVVSEAEVDAAGEVDQGRRDNLDNLFQFFRMHLDLGGVDGPPTPAVLLHGAGTPLTPTPIIDFTCSSLVGWIRGRIR